MSDTQRSLAELSAEIRSYPTPIARCDEQLTALLEQRAALMQRLAMEQSAARQVMPGRHPGAGCSPENTWINDGGFNAA